MACWFFIQHVKIFSVLMQIWQSHLEEKTSMYLAFYSEVVKRTAQLVAEWQCVGWCHGFVLPLIKNDRDALLVPRINCLVLLMFVSNFNNFL